MEIEINNEKRARSYDVQLAVKVNIYFINIYVLSSQYHNHIFNVDKLIIIQTYLININIEIK
jgi:hypothetical protein